MANIRQNWQELDKIYRKEFMIKVKLTLKI